jgi:hypothetical protein
MRQFDLVCPLLLLEFNMPSKFLFAHWPVSPPRLRAGLDGCLSVNILCIMPTLFCLYDSSGIAYLLFVCGCLFVALLCVTEDR